MLGIDYSYFARLKKRTPPEENPSGGAALVAGGNDEIAFAVWDDPALRAGAIPSERGESPRTNFR
jgi:hypothetical protein